MLVNVLAEMPGNVFANMYCNAWEWIDDISPVGSLFCCYCLSYSCSPPFPIYFCHSLLYLLFPFPNTVQHPQCTHNSYPTHPHCITNVLPKHYQCVAMHSICISNECADHCKAFSRSHGSQFKCDPVSPPCVMVLRGIPTHLLCITRCCPKGVAMDSSGNRHSRGHFGVPRHSNAFPGHCQALSERCWNWLKWKPGTPRSCWRSEAFQRICRPLPGVF